MINYTYIGIGIVIYIIVLFIFKPKDKKYYSDWKKMSFCFECEKALTWNQLMYSNGVCPKCGTVNNSAVVKHYDRSYRLVYKLPWYYIVRSSDIEFQTHTKRINT